MTTRLTVPSVVEERLLPRRRALVGWTGLLLPVSILVLCQFVLLSRKAHHITTYDTADAWEPIGSNTSAYTLKSESTLHHLSAKPSSDLACSEPFVLPAGVWPTPFDVSRLERNDTHLRCSMGCGNVTLPINVPSFIVVRAGNAICCAASV